MYRCVQNPIQTILTRPVPTINTYNPFSMVDLYWEPKVMGTVEVAVTTPAIPGMFVISTSTWAVNLVMEGCPVKDVVLLSLLTSMSGQEWDESWLLWSSSSWFLDLKVAIIASCSLFVCVRVRVWCVRVLVSQTPGTRSFVQVHPSIIALTPNSRSKGLIYFIYLSTDNQAFSLKRFYSYWAGPVFPINSS